MARPFTKANAAEMARRAQEARKRNKALAAQANEKLAAEVGNAVRDYLAKRPDVLKQIAADAYGPG